MRRTAADFAREAKADDPWEYTIKGRKTPLRPKPFSQFTMLEKQTVNKASLRYNQLLVNQDVDAILEFPFEELPVIVSLKVRLGKDFDAFWAEAKDWPDDALQAWITELDEYYDPPTADDKGAAADPESEAGKARLSSVGS